MKLDNLHAIDHQGLYYFYWAAYYKNFTEAALHCHCSKSHISKNMAKLETQLKQKLLQRTTRQIELTTAGEHLFSLLTNVFNDLDQGLHQLQDLTKQPSGLLNITAPPALAETMLAPIFGKFLDEYPNITLNCDCDSKQVDMIKKGYDIAFRNAKLEDSSYIARYLADIQFICVATNSLSKKIKKLTNPQQLNDFPIITYIRSNNEPFIFVNDKKTEYVRFNARFTSNLSMMILSTLNQTKGIAILPKFLIEKDLKDKKFIQVLPQWTLKKLPLYLVYPSKEYMPLKTNIFIKYVINYFKHNK